MTNDEKINQMSVQEKANWIEHLQLDNCSCCAHYKMSKYKIQVCELANPNKKNCISGRIAWLNSEVEND